MAPQFRALIDYGDTYIQPLLLSALASQLPPDSCTPTPDTFFPITSGAPSTLPLLQICQYESLDFEHALAHPRDSLTNAYVIRKALIRKHFLSRMVREWTVKHESSVLRRAWRECVELEVDYAEFLEEALDESESWDLVEGLRRNEAIIAAESAVDESGSGSDGTAGRANHAGDGKGRVAGGEAASREREYWILKPGMSDRGQGIRLFSTMDELRSIFEAWEEVEDEAEDEAEDEGDDVDHTDTVDRASDDATTNDHDSECITTHHLRHFLLQPYIHPPLLIADGPYSNRKFHIRTYVVAYGALKVFVYRPMLALFASEAYIAPGELASSIQEAANEAAAGEDKVLLTQMRNIHLTNTCVQSSNASATDSASAQENVFLLSDLPLPLELHHSILSQIDDVTAELFRAALAQAINFQPLPQAFEVFGVDFLVEDTRGKAEHAEDVTVQLLEVNAFPDFAQTGERLRDMVVKGLWEDITRLIIGPHFGVAADTHAKADVASNERLMKVLDLDLHLV